MSELQIRKAAHADISALEELARRSVTALSAPFHDAAQILAAAQCITTPDPDLIEDGTLFVAVSNDEIVGCGGWSRRQKPYTGSEPQPGSSTTLDPSTDAARIRAFFMAPDMARKGIGRALFEVCREAALAAGFGRLELVATLPGVRFYEKLGFRAVESLNLDLVDGSKLPAVRMTLSLET